MFLTRADLSAQLDRFLRRIPKEALHDVARPVEDAIRFAWRALGYEDGAPWRDFDAADDILGLRGFVIDFFPDPPLRPRRYHVVTREELAEEAPPERDRGPGDRPAPTDLRARYYFVARDRSLWRFMGMFSASEQTLQLSNREPASVEQLVEEQPDNPYGPLGWGHDLMVWQFEPLFKSSRQRTARLERLLNAVDKCQALHVDEVEDYELVVEWDGEPPMPRRIRDVFRHLGRETFLLRERQVVAVPHEAVEFNHEPHLVIECKSVEEAVDKANEFHGYIRRRLKRQTPGTDVRTREGVR